MRVCINVEELLIIVGRKCRSNRIGMGSDWSSIQEFAIQPDVGNWRHSGFERLQQIDFFMVFPKPFVGYLCVYPILDAVLTKSSNKDF